MLSKTKRKMHQTIGSHPIMAVLPAAKLVGDTSVGILRTKTNAKANVGNAMCEDLVRHT